jgi:hypothetical protein
MRAAQMDTILQEFDYSRIMILSVRQFCGVFVK